MKARTRWGLETAERDRRLAQYLANTSNEVLPDYRWAAVVAFYAAVQYVNAFLFERLEFIPNSHAEREAAVRMLADLTVILDDYDQLRDASRLARYSPRFA